MILFIPLDRGKAAQQSGSDAEDLGRGGERLSVAPSKDGEGAEGGREGRERTRGSQGRGREARNEAH